MYTTTMATPKRTMTTTTRMKIKKENDFGKIDINSLYSFLIIEITDLLFHQDLSRVLEFKRRRSKIKQWHNYVAVGFEATSFMLRSLRNGPNNCDKSLKRSLLSTLQPFAKTTKLQRKLSYFIYICYYWPLWISCITWQTFYWQVLIHVWFGYLKLIGTLL